MTAPASAIANPKAVQRPFWLTQSAKTIFFMILALTAALLPTV